MAKSRVRESAEHKELKENMVKNSFWNLSTLFISKLGGLIFTILIVRLLLPAGYGVYSIVLSLVTIFATFSDLGINYSITRYLSYAIKFERKKIKAYYTYLFRLKLLLTIGATAALLLLAYPLSKYLFHNISLLPLLLIGGVYLFFSSFDGFYTYIIYSAEKVKYTGIRESINQILRIVSAFLVIYLLAATYQIAGILVSFIIISLILICYSLYYIKKFIPELNKQKYEEIDTHRVKKFVGYMVIASMSGVLFSYIDTIILGAFVTPEFVGYYKAAFTLVFGVVGLAAFPNAILLTTFTKLKGKKVSSLLNMVIRYLAILTIPATLGLIVLGRYVIVLFYGHIYLSSALPLYLLTIALFPMISIGVFLMLFSAKEQSKIFARLVLIVSIINTVLNIIIVKMFVAVSYEYAILGAAIATTLSWLVYFFLSIFLIDKRMGIKISFKYMPKIIISSLIMSGIVYLTLRQIANMNLFLGAVIIIIGIIVYFGVLFLLKGIEKRDYDNTKYVMRILKERLLR